MEIDTIKISELAEGTTINNDSILVYNLNGQTKKITFQNLKNAVISALASEVSQLDADLEAEATARAAADTSLAGDITAEATARTAADTALAGDITAETTARTAADTAINTALDGKTNYHLITSTDGYTSEAAKTAIRNYCDSIPSKTPVTFTLDAGTVGFGYMYKASANYALIIYYQYANGKMLNFAMTKYNGVWSDWFDVATNGLITTLEISITTATNENVSPYGAFGEYTFSDAEKTNGFAFCAFPKGIPSSNPSICTIRGNNGGVYVFSKTAATITVIVTFVRQ